MRTYIIFSVLFAISIGTGLAENMDIGDVVAFRKALEQDGFTVQQGAIGFFDAIKAYNLGVLTSALESLNKILDVFCSAGTWS